MFGGSRVSEASSSFQGQRATSEHNLQQKKPAHTPIQSAFGGAIAHKSAKALDRQTINHQLGKPKQQSRHLQHPMHFKTGVVSASIAGVQQFRTKVQTSKHANTKRRVRHFFRESTSNKSRSASLPGVVFGGSRVSATSFPPQGQRARSEHNLQQKQPAQPPNAIRIWRGNCAQKRKGPGPTNHQTSKHPLGKPKQKGSNLNNQMHFKTGVVSEPIAGVHQFRTKAQTSKNVKKRKGEFAISSGNPPPAGPGPQAFLVLLLVVPGCHRHRFHSNGKGRKTNTTRNRRNLPPPIQSACGGIHWRRFGGIPSEFPNTSAHRPLSPHQPPPPHPRPPPPHPRPPPPHPRPPPQGQRF